MLKKTNKLLVPFIFFFLISYAILYLVRFIFPELAVTQNSSILDVFLNKGIFNGPLWFLLGLFWTNIIFYLINLIKAELLRLLLIIACAFAGYYAFKLQVNLPLYIGSALIFMPFFYFGAIIKKTPILIKNKTDKYIPIFIILLYAIVYFIPLTVDSFTMMMSYEIGAGVNFLLLYPVALCMVFALLLLCKMVKHLPLLSYIGRYSIIILCTHFMIFILTFQLSNFLGISIPLWLNFVIGMTGSTAMIPICRKLIPWFVAQKDLIRIKPKAAGRTESIKQA